MSLSGQPAALLAYLKKHPEGIDRKIAEEELGIYWLSCRIRDLKRKGYRFRITPKEVRTRQGKKTTIAVYHLITDDEKETKAEAPTTPGADRSPDKDGRPVSAPSASPRHFGPPTIDKKGQSRLPW